MIADKSAETDFTTGERVKKKKERETSLAKVIYQDDFMKKLWW